MTRILLITIVLILFTRAVSGQAQTNPVTYVPLDDDAYWQLKRFEVQGYLRQPISQTRPISRADVQRALRDLNHQQETGQIQLTAVERGVLANLNRRFLPSDSLEPHLFSWHDPHHTAVFDLLADMRVIAQSRSDDSSSVGIYTTLGAELSGAILDNHLGFYARSVNVREYTSGDDLPRTDNYFRDFEFGGVSTAYYDRTEAYLLAKVGSAGQNISLLAGKYQLIFGPGYRGQLTLSDHAGSYPLIHCNLQLGRIQFTSFTAFLKSMEIDSLRSYRVENRNRILYRQKYMAGHRIEIQVHPRLQLGLEETVIYGDRGIDVGYLIPVMFFRSYEHYLNDPDNVGWGIDWSWRFHDNWQVYGEIFIDDLSLSKIGTTWWGNKQAFLGGLYAVRPFGLGNTEFRLEAVRINPWVYTHFFPVNRYTHDNLGLGHELGPDVLSLFGEIRQYISWRWWVKLGTEWVQAGEGGRGGDIFDIHRDDVHGESATFLGGTVEDQKTITAETEFILIPHVLDFHFSYTYTRFENYRHHLDRDLNRQMYKFRIRGNW
ncbi:MAG: hypothetical protein D6675_04825 [Gemmatimonadetes bacterium]|nr:MAG: hypothetical protein D6675_04825 [Gemmatimonadota bacterium]